MNYALTGNDIARAEMAAALAIAHLKARAKKAGRRQSTYNRREIARFDALIAKLSAIMDRAYPCLVSSEDLPTTEYGAEPIMRLDPKTVRATRAAARRANKRAA